MHYGYKRLPSEEPRAPAVSSTPAAPSRQREATVPVPSRRHEAPVRSFYNRPPQQQRRESALSKRYDGGIVFSKSVDPCVIHPHNRLVQWWNIAVSMLLLVDVIYLPVETAFSRALPRRLITGFNVASTIVFSLDICLQFFVQVPSRSGEYWIFNHQEIVRIYLSGFFLVDLISVIPFCEVYALTGLPSDSRVYIAHLLQLLRFLRMLRFRHLRSTFQYQVQFSQFTRSVVFMGALILVSVHIMSCAWATLGNYEDDSDWVTKLQAAKAFGPLSSTMNDSIALYLTSSYFVLNTITGIGYGDIGPTNMAEYVFLIVMMLVGSLVWATIIGEIVSLMQHANMDEVNHQEKMDAVLEMSLEHGFSSDLRSRLQAYFKQWRVLRRTAFAQGMVSKMSQELALEFVHAIHNAWLSNIWWLHNISCTTFAAQLTLAASPRLYCPRECIAPSASLHAIQRGLCIHGKQILSKNMVWGVDVLLSQASLRESKITLAISYLHALRLSREALESTLERFPHEQEHVRRAFLILCVSRGIKREAKRIKATGRKPLPVVGGAEEAQPEEALLPRQSTPPPAMAVTLEQRLDALQEMVDGQLASMEAQVAEVLEIIARHTDQPHKAPLSPMMHAPRPTRTKSLLPDGVNSPLTRSPSKISFQSFRQRN